MAQPNAKRASMNPDNFVAGGLMGDVDVEVTELIATLDPPENYSFNDRCFVKATFKVLDTEEIHENWWSAGANTEVVPDDTGNYLLLVGQSTQLKRSSNYYAFLNSLVQNCGMPKDKLDQEGGLSLLVGAKLHVIQAPAPERSGLKSTAKEGGREKTILIASKVISWPWDKAAKAKGRVNQPAASQPAAQAPAAAAASTEDEDTQALEIIAKVLGSESMKVEALKVKVFQACTPLGLGKDARTAIMAKSQDVQWLSDHGFTVAGDTVKI